MVHNQTNRFLAENNILYNFQSGFRWHHSTNLCLVHLTEKILKGLHEGLLTGMILIDLQIAFDTINHEVLLQKLKTIRFSEQSMHWFRSYLCDRLFLIKTENKLSDFGKISSGVPWGSFLGLALFLDLCQWYASSSKIKFALVCLSTNKMQRNKYKTTSTSNISWMCIRWVNFWWTYGTMALKF